MEQTVTNTPAVQAPGRWVSDSTSSDERISAYAHKIPLVANTPNILRIVDGDNYVKYWEAWIINDEGVKKPYILGMEDFEGKLHYNILMEIVGDPLRFFKGGILETVKGPDGKALAKYRDIDHRVWNMVSNNGDVSGSAGSWKPKKNYGFNCIPRGMEQNTETGVFYNWSVDNQHMELLSGGQTIFDALKNLRENYGKLEDYDINILKQGSGKENTKYFANKAEKDKFPQVVLGPITDFEKKFEAYDLLTECGPTSDEVIYSDLKRSIGDIDRAIGTNFLQKLENSLMSKGTLSTPAPTTSRVPEQSKSQVDVPVASISPVPEVPKTDVPSINTELPMRELPPRAIEASAPTIEADKVDTVECFFCKKPISVNEPTCPECGQTVFAPCTECKEPFSMSLSTCPKCGKQYGPVITQAS